MLTRRNFLLAQAGALLAFAAGGTAQASGAAAKDGAASTARKERLSRFTVCIDPGHANRADSRRERVSPYGGGTQMRETGGTSGRRSGPEYKVNMDIAKRLAAYLRKSGVKVVMTKTRHGKTMSNRQRAAVANKCKADLFIRIHCDSGGMSGFMTCMPGKSGYQRNKKLYKKSQRASRYLHARVRKALKARNRGCHARTDLAGFNWCKRPAVLFEVAVMDNAGDDRKLASKRYRQKAAAAIGSATLKWLERSA